MGDHDVDSLLANLQRVSEVLSLQVTQAGPRLSDEGNQIGGSGSTAQYQFAHLEYGAYRDGL